MDILNILLDKGRNEEDLTAEELQAATNYGLEQVRERRNKLLDLTDKYTSSDFPLTDTQRTNILAYRQALRDITDTTPVVNWRTGLVDNITWPTSEFVTEHDFIMTGTNLVPVEE